MNYKLFLIAFFSLKAFAMGHPSDQVSSTTQGKPTNRRPLEIISADCCYNLTTHAAPYLIKRNISEFKKHPEKEFADYWIENREDMVGDAKAAVIAAQCLQHTRQNADREVEGLACVQLQFACRNRELIKTFDEHAMIVVKAYINHKKTLSPLPPYNRPPAFI